MRAPRARGQDGRQDEGQDPSTRRRKVEPQIVKAVFCAFCVLCGRRGCSGGAGHEEVRVVLEETPARQDLLALAVAVCQARLRREATALSRPRVQLCKGQVASTCHRVCLPASMNRDFMLTIYSWSRIATHDVQLITRKLLNQENNGDNGAYFFSPPGVARAGAHASRLRSKGRK